MTHSHAMVSPPAAAGGASSPGDPTALTTYSTSSAASSFTTDSITPTANALVFVFVAANETGLDANLTAPSVTGNGSTGALVDENLPAEPKSSWLFRYQNASPSAGGVTVDFGAQSISGVVVHVVQLTNVPVGNNGADALGQTTAHPTGFGRRKDGNVATTMDTFLEAFSDATNNVALMFCAKSGTETPTYSAGWTQLASAVAVSHALVAWKRGEDTSPSFTVTSGVDYYTFSVEVRSTSAPSRPPISVEWLTRSSSTTNTTNYTGATITVVANRTHFAWILSTATGGSAGPSSVRNGAAGQLWTKQSEVASGDHRLTLWSCMIGSDDTQQFRISHAANQQGCLWTVGSLPGALTTGTNGTNAFRLPANNSGTSTTPSVTLAAFGDTDNGVMAAVGYAASPTQWPSVVPEPGSVPADQRSGTNSITTPTLALAAEHRSTPDTSMGFTLPSSVAWLELAAELVAA